MRSLRKKQREGISLPGSGPSFAASKLLQSAKHNDSKSLTQGASAGNMSKIHRSPVLADSADENSLSKVRSIPFFLALYFSCLNHNFHRCLQPLLPSSSSISLAPKSSPKASAATAVRLENFPANDVDQNSGFSNSEQSRQGEWCEEEDGMASIEVRIPFCIHRIAILYFYLLARSLTNHFALEHGRKGA